MCGGAANEIMCAIFRVLMEVSRLFNQAKDFSVIYMHLHARFSIGWNAAALSTESYRVPVVYTVCYQAVLSTHVIVICAACPDQGIVQLLSYTSVVTGWNASALLAC